MALFVGWSTFADKHNIPVPGQNWWSKLDSKGCTYLHNNQWSLVKWECWYPLPTRLSSVWILDNTPVQGEGTLTIKDITSLDELKVIISKLKTLQQEKIPVNAKDIKNNELYQRFTILHPNITSDKVLVNAYPTFYKAEVVAQLKDALTREAQLKALPVMTTPTTATKNSTTTPPTAANPQIDLVAQSLSSLLYALQTSNPDLMNKLITAMQDLIKKTQAEYNGANTARLNGSSATATINAVKWWNTVKTKYNRDRIAPNGNGCIYKDPDTWFEVQINDCYSEFIEL